MATTVAEILVEVNQRLQTDDTEAQILSAVQWVLDDLSRKDMLIDSDATQSLVANDKTIDFPAGYRAPVAITLTDSESNLTRGSLDKLKGGHEQYRDLIRNNESTGIPYWYSQFNKKFYLWSIPNTAYDVLIEYYKDHALLDLDDEESVIEFDDSFTDAINSGTTYRMAMQTGRTRMVNMWGPDYIEERTKKDNETYRNPRIVRSN